MKKKSASQSAFFNLRVLIGLFVVLAGVFLALAGFGTFSGITASSAQAQQTHKIIDIPGLPPGFDCSRIHQLGIDKMENLRAGLIMIACGESPGGQAEEGGQAQKGEASPFRGLSPSMQKLLAPSFIGGSDVDVILPDGTFPHVTQSESMEWCGASNTCVVNYNDSRTAPSCYSGISYSSDGGATWHASQQLCSGHGTNFGDPIVVYNAHLNKWFAGDLATGCGGQGVGLWTSLDGITWTPGACAANTGAGDRESMWVDDNSSSPFYGRMYVSYNDFNVGGGALYITHSDDGITWTPVQLNPAFIRDVQVTGDLQNSGRVYVASMNENGGGLGNRQNVMYRSTDGGVTWANSLAGPVFAAPGRVACSANSYFVCMFGADAWRHMGWGEPAANGSVVSLDYAACGQNVSCGGATDHGDIYYIRSTDAGVTWGTPVRLNTDMGTAIQWQPSLAATQAGALFASWYDGREVNGGADLNCTPGSPSQNCYRRWGRVSFDNGATWQPDDMVGRALTPLPGQPDGGVQPNYQGDYDYHSSLGTNIIGGWTDGRNIISSQSQQDVFVNFVQGGFGVTSTIPACNSVINTQPTNFVVNLSGAVDPTTVQATDFTVNGIPANSFTLGMSNTQITFTFNSSPVTMQGPQTMHIPAGAFNDTSAHPVADFTCTFCYALTPLQVTTTNPPVGGTFSPPAPGTYTYAVNFNQAIDPASVQTSDLTLTGNVGGTVTNVTVAGSTATFTVNFQFGGSVTASIAAGAITAEGCNGNAAFSGNYTVEGCPPAQYVITPGTDTIVPGTIDTGSHCDDCATTVALPFPFQLYGTTYNSVGVVSNGFINFVSPNNTFVTACLPATGFDNTIFPLWHDWRTDVGLSGCSTFTNGCGIFTSVSGVAPNRIFNIEWHAVRFADNTQTGNFEVRLYENSTATNGRFDVIYGASAGTPGAGDSAGVQGTSGGGFFTQDFCNLAAPQNVSRAYTFPPCAPMASDALSRKVHGGAGTFDIPLPLSGNVGVECRSGGGTYQMIIDFPTTVTVQSASVTSGTGMVSSFSGSGTSQITVNLTGVTDAQRITMTLHNVNNGTSTGDVPVSMGVLIGDVNGNAAVNSSDVSLTKSKVGQAVDGTNFREDVNANGTISSTDVALVKSDVGHALPP